MLFKKKKKSSPKDMFTDFREEGGGRNMDVRDTAID